MADEKKKVFASESNKPKNLKKLKSPWIPNINNSDNLKWHILDHHTRSAYLEGNDYKGEPIWAKSVATPIGMTPEEHHQLLHATGEFEEGQEHQHFEPKR